MKQDTLTKNQDMKNDPNHIPTETSCFKNIEVGHTPILKQNKRILLWDLLKILLKMTPNMSNMMNNEVLQI
jgi:hypothetical protein